MKRLNDVIESFLKGDESLRAAPYLGGPPRKVSADKVNFLTDQLKAAATQNGRTATILIILYIAMLIGGFVIVFTLYHNPKLMRGALGGSFLSLLGILTGLRSIWREQSQFNVMIALLPSLSPEEAIKVVETYYYKSKNKPTQSA
jgi:hypothetical protein